MTDTLPVPYSIWQNSEMPFESRYVENVTKIPRRNVYSGTVPVPTMKFYNNPAEVAREVLEDLFYTFNMDHPGDFHGHSLSVGDVVTVGESSWLCAPIGWEPCPAPSETV